MKKIFLKLSMIETKNDIYIDPFEIVSFVEKTERSGRMDNDGKFEPSITFVELHTKTGALIKVIATGQGIVDLINQANEINV